MDPGLLVLGACAVGATALLRVFKKQSEGFDVPQVGTYPVTAAQGQQMYNPLSLAADPRVTAPAIANMPADQQASYVRAVNAALTPTSTDTSVPGRITMVPGTNTTPVYVPDSSSIIVKAAFCENMAMTANPFGDAKFKEHCGVCLSSGTTNAGRAFTGPKGLYIDPAAKAAAIALIADSPVPYTNTKPTLGTCTGATGGVGSTYSFALTNNELQDFMSRVTCQHNKNLDGTCAVCLEDGSYTYVGDTKSSPLKTVTFWVAGVGTLNATLAGKAITFANSKTTLVLSSTPVSFKAKLAEDSFLNFAVQAPLLPTPGAKKESSGCQRDPEVFLGQVVFGRLGVSRPKNHTFSRNEWFLLPRNNLAKNHFGVPLGAIVFADKSKVLGQMWSGPGGGLDYSGRRHY